MTEDVALIATRLKDMKVRHPDQSNALIWPAASWDEIKCEMRQTKRVPPA